MPESGGQATRVLVIGSGLGTNAALGLEVPLSHRKWVTNGAGGVCEVTAEERAGRRSEESFRGFMGERFGYLWEREDGYLGNAGFLYGVLLHAFDLQVDVLDHPFACSDKDVVLVEHQGQSREEILQRLEAEKMAMWEQHYSDSYATSICCLLSKKTFDVVLSASKGVYQLAHAIGARASKNPALDHAVAGICAALGVVLLNGAENSPAFEGAPALAEVSATLLAHPLVRRLVLTSHGSVASSQLRRRVVEASAHPSAVSEQHVLFYSSKDLRSVANRETHALPWSLVFPEECWWPGEGKPPRLVNPDGSLAALTVPASSRPLATLLRWAGTHDSTSTSELQSMSQFPGEQRLASVELSLAHLTPVAKDAHGLAHVFQDIRLDAREGFGSNVRMEDTSPSIVSAGSSLVEPYRFEPVEPVYDILFDAQMEQLQVVLMDVQTGARMSVEELLSSEGHECARLVRFFRYYDDHSAKIQECLAKLDPEALQREEGQQCQLRRDLEQLTCIMLEELCALNKNMGNFLWTGLMSTATAHASSKRFGRDMLEMVIKIELARLGASYFGFSRAGVNAEHAVAGADSSLGDVCDEYLCGVARDSGSTHQPPVKNIEGYIRRDLTAGGEMQPEQLQPLLKAAVCAQGLAGLPQYGFSDCGHGLGFRFFTDGKGWLSTSCRVEDLDFARCAAKLFAVGSRADEQSLLIANLLLGHTCAEGYFVLPSQLLAPDFMQRNGYRVVAYRRFGNAGANWHGERDAGWASFASHWQQVAPALRPLAFPKHGHAKLKSKVFGQVGAYPADIGRGGTDAKVYLFDSCLRAVRSPAASCVADAVNRNVLSWWEPQLYALTPEDVGQDALQFLQRGAEATGAKLIFSSEDERLLLTLQTLLDSVLLRARSLWLAGLEKDGVTRRTRPFPGFGSLEHMDPQLPGMIAGLVNANIREHDRLAAGKPSHANMGPTNARRVANTGIFDADSKQMFIHAFWDNCAGQVDLEEGSASSKGQSTCLSKAEVVATMNCSLRFNSRMGHRRIADTRLAALRMRQQRLSACERLLQNLEGGENRGSYVEDSQCARLFAHMLHMLGNYNVFQDLQEEVNVLLASIGSCS